MVFHDKQQIWPQSTLSFISGGTRLLQVNYFMTRTSIFVALFQLEPQNFVRTFLTFWVLILTQILILIKFLSVDMSISLHH